ncbi:MAG: aquaporin [Chloroflexi bacterium]|nr:aquaporin [Chloroflexota bacterium]
MLANLHLMKEKRVHHSPGLLQACVAEVLGTFLLVLFGTGVVAAAVFTGAQVGLWQIAIVWGLGVTLAIYITAGVSGGHLNPAVSLAFAIFRNREFPWTRVFPYWAGQLTGAALAGLAVLGLFGPFITRFELQHNLVRGEPGSELSGMSFGEYFPNPALFGTGPESHALISPVGAAIVEGFGTAILVFTIFALLDRRNSSLSAKYLAPVFIGLTIAVLISLFAPMTQAGWNPARDFGPRLVAFFAGWDSVAIPGPRTGFWAYIIGPLVGGPLGAAIYEFVLRPGLKTVLNNGTEGSSVED